MIEYTQTLVRVMLAWRWLLLAAVAFDAFHPAVPVKGGLSDLVPRLPALTEISAALVLATWTVLATALTALFKGKNRTLVMGLLDAGVAAVVLVGFPASTATPLLFTIPVVELSALGMSWAVGAAALFALGALGLLRLDGADANQLREAAWAPLSIVLSGVLAVAVQAQARQESQTKALFSIVETIQQLGASASVERILGVALADIRQIFDCTTCAIYLEDSAGEERLVRAAAVDTPLQGAFKDVNPRTTSSIVREVMREKKAFLVPDFRAWQPEEAISHDASLRGTIVAPLLFDEKAVGVLFISSHTAGFYQTSHLRLLATLANQMAVAISNVQMQKSTAEMAVTDSLSGLFTHGHFQENLGSQLTDAKYKKQPLSLIILDVDFFKRVNDSYGHPQGDALLKQLGALLKAEARSGDVLCRYGGDEFTVTLPNTTHAQATLLAESLREKVEAYDFVLGSQIVHVTVSGGVATFPEDGETKLELVSQADAAMFKAKRQGRNCVVRRDEAALLKKLDLADGEREDA